MNKRAFNKTLRTSLIYVKVVLKSAGTSSYFQSLIKIIYIPERDSNPVGPHPYRGLSPFLQALPTFTEYDLILATKVCFYKKKIHY